MISVMLVCLILAFVFTLMAAVTVPGHPRISWGWLGIMCYFLGLLLTAAGVR